MREQLRRRNVVDNNGVSTIGVADLYNDEEKQEEIRGLSWVYCLVLIIFHTVLFLLAVYAHHYVPESKSGVSTGDFAEWRARVHLDKITSYGHRITGSFANENETVDYLLNTLYSIKDVARDDVVIDVDIQRPTGFFTIDFLEGQTSFYKNITNIIAKVSSKDNYPAKHSILVNAHFDSALGGPGASDDAVSCAAMLEVIRALTTAPENLVNHSLVFLFNGAEENILQASHGFITQHLWAKNVRVFVNLEAAGAGGRELVFQTGPEHPWLIKMYANSANYPFASIIGQEFFQTGLIPGDTDFRIFRDYGNIPGIDIAYVSNGYVYHTSRDLPNAITPGSIQRAGDNLLEMLKQLSKSSLVADPSQDKHGAMVFYDFLGLFLVIYPQRIGFLLNTVVAIITYVSIAMKFSKRYFKDAGTNNKVSEFHTTRTNTLCIREFFISLLTTVVSWVLSIILVLVIAQLITSSGHSLSWYCKPYLLVGIYVLPAVLVVSSFHYCRATFFQNNNYWVNRWNQEAHVFYAVLFIWNTLLSVMTYYNLGSAFLTLILVAFPLFIRVFLWEFCFKNNSLSTLSKNSTGFFWMYLSSFSIPVLFCSYVLWMHLEFVVPIFGRTGTNDPPEFLISVFVSFFTLVIMSYSTSLIYVYDQVKPIAVVLTGVWLSSLAAVLLGMFFPYSAQPWCPKRLVIQHISRTFHDVSGNIHHSDSGLWVVPFDYLGVKHIDHLPEFKEAQIPDIEFGDFPYYFPVNFMFDTTWYIPGPKPEVAAPLSVKLVSKDNKNNGQSRLNFEVQGPCHMGLQISLRPGVDLLNSSLGELYHRYIPRKGLPSGEEYFVYYSHGVYTGPWEFWLDVIQSSSSNEATVDIGFAAHYTDQKYSSSMFMDNFKKKLPDWVNTATWLSTYEKWVF